MPSVTTTASRVKEPRLVREHTLANRDSATPGVIRGLIEDAATEYTSVFGPQPSGTAAAQRDLRGPAWRAFETLQARFKKDVRVDVKVSA